MTPEKNPLLEKAVTLLSYRAHSRKELSDKLKHKTGCKDAELAEVLDRLEELGFLNDRTYASSVVRSCARKGYGAQRALSKLARRGIPKELREEALADMPETDGTLEQLIRGRLRNPANRDEVRKVSASMVRRGYYWDEIRHAIERVGAEAEPED
jgi:regulatory protein